MKRIFYSTLVLVALISCGNKQKSDADMQDSLAVADSMLEGPCGTTDGPQTGEEVFGKVADWSRIIHWSAFGDIESIAYYDIDDDGIPEAILRGNDSGNYNYAICTCGAKGGGLGDGSNVQYVVSSMDMSRFGIIKGQPFIFCNHVDEAAGYDTQQYFKIAKSRLEDTYSMLMITKGGNTSYEYSCVKDENLVDNFTQKQYEAAVPKSILDVVDLEELDWQSLGASSEVSGASTVKGFVPMGQRSWPVKGGVGVRNFVTALMPGYSEYFYENFNADSKLSDFFEPHELEIDDKNGYLSYYFEGDSQSSFECCYWNRKDGSILVAFFEEYCGFDEANKQHHFYRSSTLNFFVYDKGSKMLNPIPWPFDLKVGNKQSLHVELPRKGKDIKYIILSAAPDEPGFDDSDMKTLKFDGMGFTK